MYLIIDVVNTMVIKLSTCVVSYMLFFGELEQKAMVLQIIFKKLSTAVLGKNKCQMHSSAFSSFPKFQQIVLKLLL
jgi:hypothetical protein